MNKQRELLERSLEVIKLFVPSYGLLIEEIEAELAKPEQEPVGEIYKRSSYDNCVWRDVIWNGKMPPIGTKLYTSPPQYEPLSDDEIMDIAWNTNIEENSNYIIAVSRAIEKRITEGKK